MAHVDALGRPSCARGVVDQDPVAYTLAMFFLWGVAMAVAGGVIGWMLRSLRRRREVVELRARIDELEAAARKRGPTPGLPP